MLGSFWRVERRLECRSGSLAVPAPGEVVLGSLGSLVELAGGRDCVVRLRDLTWVPLEVEALAGQVRREAVGRRSGSCQVSPHRMSHGRHVRP